jgi:streptogramin lyase/two-component sensor histidine kinase
MRNHSGTAIFITCLLTVITGYLPAQQVLRQVDPVELSIEEIGVAQGLSQGMVHGLQVDLKGYLWIGTKDGLNRYDGNHFHVFRHDPHDPTSIASNYIRSLNIDDRGLIWIGTNAAGLDLYDPVKSAFIHFGKVLNSSHVPMMQCVTQIFSDPNGKVILWDGTGKRCEILVPVVGENPFSSSGWQIKSFNDVYHHDPAIPLPDAYMLGFGQDGALLFQFDNILYKFYPDHTEKLSQPQVFDQKELKHIDKTKASFYTYYFLDDHRELYCINHEDKILYVWNEKEKVFKARLKLPSSYPLLAKRFFVDQQGRIWANSHLSPLLRINPEQGTFQQLNVTRYHFAGTDETDFGIYCEDNQHNLWVGTSGNGVIKITSRNDQFTRLSTETQDHFGMRVIRDGKSFKIHDQISLAQEKEWRTRFEAAKLMRISAYCEDSVHGLWSLAISNDQLKHYLVRFNVDDYSFSSWPFELCQQTPFENESAIMIDKSGMMWIGAECIDGEALLARLHYPDSMQDRFVFPVEVIRSEHPFVTDWYVDDQNIFWIGTKQGLFAFDPATSQWQQWYADPSHPDGLSNNYILSICPDPKLPGNYLWIGTDGGGLNRMDIHAKTFQHYSTEEGLPNNVIYAVQSDNHDHLWMSTNLGLCRFDPATAEVWSFTVEDGLRSNEFNRMQYGKTSDGLLYFGGIEGPTIFDPEVFYSTSSPSPIVINRLKLSNKEIIFSPVAGKKNEHAYHLPAPMENCSKLTFPYSERMITLGFSLLDFTNPNGNKYRYKLEGFNTDWIEAGAENEAVFTNLSPRTYTFLVSGRNSENAWSAPARLQMTILSPWWASWWFRSLVVLVIAAGIYGLYRYRLQQAMRLQHLRNRIAADLHDEIGSTLSSISLAGTVIQHKLKNHHPEVDGLVHKINHHTQSMMEAMSDIVWAVNTKNDRFDQVLHRMRAFAAEILEPKEIMVHFDVSPNVSPLQLDMQQRKNLYLIFKEAINNAAKYAQCNNVWIIITYVHGRLMMEVRDDGVGFDIQSIQTPVRVSEDVPPKTGMGGNGIQNMDQRAHELKGKLQLFSSPGQGTKVILTFAV